MRVCVIGAKGQDGSILTHKLLKKNIQTHCFTRNNFDLQDRNKIKEILFKIKPTHIFYLAAAHASVVEMDKISKYEFFSVNYKGLENLVRCLESLQLCPWIFYPLSSKLYLNNSVVSESSIPTANCSYSESKLLAKEFMLRNYSGDCICFPIMFNHESKFRNSTFLSSILVEFFSGKTNQLEIRYPNDRVDWGLATEFCDVFIELALMNFYGSIVIATGKAIKIKEMLQTLCDKYSKDFKVIKFQNLDMNERGVFSDISYLRQTVLNPPKTHGWAVIDQIIRDAYEL